MQPAPGIELDADGRFLLSGDANQPDAGYLRDLLQQNVVRIGINGRERQRVRSDCEHEDRCVRRVDFADLGLRCWYQPDLSTDERNRRAEPTECLGGGLTVHATQAEYSSANVIPFAYSRWE